jgi:magnesium chelatase subunit I
MSESIETLTDLLERASARRFLDLPGLEDFGYADQNNFPFLALVGQPEMKLALLLTLINPNVGGVLLLGPRGTGKTTAVRSLVDLMPEVPRSRCHYGCMPEDIELGGIDAICQDCAKKYGQDEPLTYLDQVQLIELPLNARLEDVVGGIDERAAVHDRLRLKKGLLARADRHLLYIDEVNLLSDDVVDVILDAAAQGKYTVHRGSMAGTYRSRFVLIGSMNPEEGQLRPQILDRFGLRVIVRGLHDRQERLEAYRRSVNFLNQPQELVRAYAGGTAQARNELEEARKQLAKVEITEKALVFGLSLIEGLGIESLRAEITLFEAARAHAVADGRKKAGLKDIRVTAPLALRSRRSAFIKDYLANQAEEEEHLSELVRSLSKKKHTRKKTAPKKRAAKSNSG